MGGEGRVCERKKKGGNIGKCDGNAKVVLDEVVGDMSGGKEEREW